MARYVGWAVGVEEYEGLVLRWLSMNTAVPERARYVGWAGGACERGWRK